MSDSSSQVKQGSQIRRGENLKFGDWLRQERKRRDLTQEKLGQKLDYTLDYISKLENGERRGTEEVAERLLEKMLNTENTISEEEQVAFKNFVVGVGTYQDWLRVREAEPPVPIHHNDIHGSQLPLLSLFSSMLAERRAEEAAKRAEEAAKRAEEAAERAKEGEKQAKEAVQEAERAKEGEKQAKEAAERERGAAKRAEEAAERAKEGEKQAKEAAERERGATEREREAVAKATERVKEAERQARVAAYRESKATERVKEAERQAKEAAEREREAVAKATKATQEAELAKEAERQAKEAAKKVPQYTSSRTSDSSGVGGCLTLLIVLGLVLWAGILKIGLNPLKVELNYDKLANVLDVLKKPTLSESDLMKGAQPFTTPESGSLQPSSWDIRYFSPTTSEVKSTPPSNFAVECTFTNPYNWSEWSYGFLYSVVSVGASKTTTITYKTFLKSDGTWAHISGDHVPPQVGTVSNMNLSVTLTNTINLIVKGSDHYLFVNHRFVSMLNIQDTKNRVKISIGTGLLPGNFQGKFATTAQLNTFPTPEPLYRSRRVTGIPDPPTPISYEPTSYNDFTISWFP